MNWSNVTPMVLVAPRPVRVEATRPDAKAGVAWLVKESIPFPYVICPSCTVVSKNPVCAVPTNMGCESAFYFSFIVNNYHRLPRSVAFCHGHDHVQNTKRKSKESILERLQKLLPHVHEKLFIWYGEGEFPRSPKLLRQSNLSHDPPEALTHFSPNYIYIYTYICIYIYIHYTYPMKNLLAKTILGDDDFNHHYVQLCLWLSFFDFRFLKLYL